MKKCRKAYNEAYREANKDKIKTDSAKYYKDNKDALSAYSANWVKNNKDKLKEYRKNNQEKLKEQLKAPHRKYKSMSRKNRRPLVVEITLEQYVEIIKDRICYYCDESFKNEVGSNLNRIDNSKGYLLNNVKPCCSTCNFIMLDFTLKELKPRLSTKFIERIEDSMIMKQIEDCYMVGFDHKDDFLGPFKNYKVNDTYFRVYELTKYFKISTTTNDNLSPLIELDFFESWKNEDLVKYL